MYYSTSFFLSAAYFEMPNIKEQGFSHVSDEELAKYLSDAYKGEGMSDISVDISHNDKGKIVSLRGQKTIAGTNDTFKRVFYYGKKSLMVLELGSPAKIFPTLEMFKFEESLKIKQ